MGRIADSLRANLKEIAQSDARSLTEMDAELKAETKDRISRKNTIVKIELYFLSIISLCKNKLILKL